jgi:energy-coupling factor transporter ATP-binding protein EcfA2
MKDSVRQLQQLIQSSNFNGAAVKRITVKESINDTYINEGSEGVLRILHKASENESADEQQDEQKNQPQLEIVNENKLLFACTHVEYYILGSISQDLSNLKVMLMAVDIATGKKERIKTDLYDRETIRFIADQIGGNFSLNPELVEVDLLQLTDMLEQHREHQLDLAKGGYASQRNYVTVPPERRKVCMEFLMNPNLILEIDKLLLQTGIVGEENTRKLLFIIAVSYKNTDPLHALLHSESGSGKSHLINSIAKCIPQEDVLSITRVSSKSFYHYTQNELINRLVLLQDYDGLDSEAQFAFRELQSAGFITSSVAHKDKNGNLVSTIKMVKGSFASLATSTHEVYLDNLSRSVLVGVDESNEQTERIINYQNKRLAGWINTDEEMNAQLFLQDCIRCLKPYEVINRYADKIKLPVEAKMLRRLNNHYQAFVKHITILHQHQRERDEQGRLIAQPEDLKLACDILMDSILLKVDDLDAPTRQFFDRLKKLVQNKKDSQPGSGFTQRDVRLNLHVSKTQCFRFFDTLIQQEYLQKVGGHANKGLLYKITYWDDQDKVKTRIKSELGQQLRKLAG